MNGDFTFSWPTCAQAHPTVYSHIPLPQAHGGRRDNRGLKGAWKNAKVLASTPAVRSREEKSPGVIWDRSSTLSFTFPSKQFKSYGLIKEEEEYKKRERLAFF